MPGSWSIWHSQRATAQKHESFLQKAKHGISDKEALFLSSPFALRAPSPCPPPSSKWEARSTIKCICTDMLPLKPSGPSQHYSRHLSHFFIPAQDSQKSAIFWNMFLLFCEFSSHTEIRKVSHFENRLANRHVFVLVCLDAYQLLLESELLLGQESWTMAWIGNHALQALIRVHTKGSCNNALLRRV